MTHFRLQPGERFYAGYHEWVVHQDEARVILAQGFVRINGRELAAHEVDSFGSYKQIRVTGLNQYGDPSDPQCPAINNSTWWLKRR